MPDAAHLQSIGGGASEPGAGLTGLIDDLRQLGEFAAITRRHLGSICTATEQAGVDILSRLATIESVVGKLVAFIDGSLNAPEVAQTLAQAQLGMEARSAIVRRLAGEREADATQAGVRLAEVRGIAHELADLVGGCTRSRAIRN